ncbi:hypothetical protein R1sor_000127 [Riccia sorocarpa]|uniref:Uncharacterized protein n=1 Tax=Riccia sorocarpa TaxID=122646 RepID=A0ABD3GVG7_9MARC
MNTQSWLGVARRRSRIKWAQQGDANTMYFFNTLKAKQQQEKMTGLMDEDGRRGKILEMVHSFYSTLFTQPSITMEDRQEQREVLKLVKEKKITIYFNFGSGLLSFRYRRLTVRSVHAIGRTFEISNYKRALMFEPRKIYEFQDLLLPDSTRDWGDRLID